MKPGACPVDLGGFPFLSCLQGAVQGELGGLNLPPAMGDRGIVGRLSSIVQVRQVYPEGLVSSSGHRLEKPGVPGGSAAGWCSAAGP